MQPQEALSFTELVLNASFLVQCVMLFLLGLSIASWTIIISRNNQYRVGRAKADAFEDRFWSGIDLNNLYQECMQRPDDLVGLEVIYSAGFKEFVRLVNSGPADQDVVMDGTYRQMKVACSREVELLETNLPTLATIGSISPYIGLFGTVWGIMHAFVALAAVKNATLAMVAPPIAEALIATAMGLFAAIPAVMFYNRFVTKVEALENRYYNFMDEFSTILNRRLVTIRTQLNRQQFNQDNAQNQAQPTAPTPVAVNMGSSPDGNDLSAMNNLNAINPSRPPEGDSYQQEYDEPFDQSDEAASIAQAVAGHKSNQNPVQVPSIKEQARPAVANQDMNAQRAAQQNQNRRAAANTLGGVSASNRNLNPQQLNDRNMAAGYRGVVPPRNASNNNVNAQLPGGPATAVKPNQGLKPESNYRSGNNFDNRQQKKKADDAPHYISPGGQTPRRNRPSGADGS